MTTENSTIRPKILIVGAGFGGLMTATWNTRGCFKISNPYKGLGIYDGNLSYVGGIDVTDYRKHTGYDMIIFPRIDMYRLLLSQLDSERLRLGKKVISTLQNQATGVTTRCADGSEHQGDILVGADCALKLQLLQDQKNEAITTGEFKNIEWGPEANESVIKEFRGFRCALGGTMGDLTDATPKDRISRVFLDEKLFQSWYFGRTVLIGDACHKMLPSAGSGKVLRLNVVGNLTYVSVPLSTLILQNRVIRCDERFAGAMILVNSIVDMASSTSENISQAFQEYREDRLRSRWIKQRLSQQFSTVRLGRNGLSATPSST
ncbi:hypothetical protein BGX27_008774 [Mortierella sp. AM989]|nr:hypothetical protein BGX27_008774 [Mortierella sp. AM989]